MQRLPKPSMGFLNFVAMIVQVFSWYLLRSDWRNYLYGFVFRFWFFVDSEYMESIMSSNHLERSWKGLFSTWSSPCISISWSTIKVYFGIMLLRWWFSFFRFTVLLSLLLWQMIHQQCHLLTKAWRILASWAMIQAWNPSKITSSIE